MKMNRHPSKFPNYFQDVAFNFELLNGIFRKDDSIRFLQIGAYTGDASVWILERFSGFGSFTLIDVDTWSNGDSPEMNWQDFKDIERFYAARTKAFSSQGRLQTFKGTSDSFFFENRTLFDFIYIDGNHQPQQVAKDAINAFEALKPGGILAFDDYLGAGNLKVNERPKIAIDFFCSLFSDSLEVLVSNYQLWIKKIYYATG